MARYDYDRIARDPAKQQELLNFCDTFEQFLLDNNMQGLELERYQEVLGDFRETVQGNEVKHGIELDDRQNVYTIPYDFDNMVDFMRGRMVHLADAAPELFEKMKQNVPGAEQFLDGIEMPERGTAGYYFDRSRDYMSFVGFNVLDGDKLQPQRRTMEVISARLHVATGFALQEATKGAKDWKKVPIDSEVLERRRMEIDHDIDNGSGILGDMMLYTEKGGSELYPPLLCTEPNDLANEIDERYRSSILPESVKCIQDIYAKKKDKIDEINVAQNALPTMVMAAIAASDPRKYKNFLDVEKQAEQYQHLYEGFTKGKSAQELCALLTDDPAETLRAVQTYAPPREGAHRGVAAEAQGVAGRGGEAAPHGGDHRQP